MRFECRPAVKDMAGDGIALDIADAALVLPPAFARAGSWCAPGTVRKHAAGNPSGVQTRAAVHWSGPPRWPRHDARPPVAHCRTAHLAAPPRRPPTPLPCQRTRPLAAPAETPAQTHSAN